MSSGRRRVRSTIIPASGEASWGSRKATNVSPAAPLLPVSCLTQTPIASDSERSPSSDSAWPARYSRASRSAISRRTPQSSTR